jgi:hypothetical protein
MGHPLGAFPPWPDGWWPRHGSGAGRLWEGRRSAMREVDGAEVGGGFFGGRQGRPVVASKVHLVRPAGSPVSIDMILGVRACLHYPAAHHEPDRLTGRGALPHQLTLRSPPWQAHPVLQPTRPMSANSTLRHRRPRLPASRRQSRVLLEVAAGLGDLRAAPLATPAHGGHPDPLMQELRHVVGLEQHEGTGPPRR